MVDIHSHILPEIDDGSRSLDESLEMGRISADDGVYVIIVTPHSHDHIHKTHIPAFLPEKLDDLNTSLERRSQIVLCAELRFTHDVVNHLCTEKRASTINGGPYAFNEFPHQV